MFSVFYSNYIYLTTILPVYLINFSLLMLWVSFFAKNNYKNSTKLNYIVNLYFYFILSGLPITIIFIFKNIFFIFALTFNGFILLVYFCIMNTLFAYMYFKMYKFFFITNNNNLITNNYINNSAVYYFWVYFGFNILINIALFIYLLSL